jgi:hypothetical protein
MQWRKAMLVGITKSMSEARNFRLNDLTAEAVVMEETRWTKRLMTGA